jgi:hypothetical protein
LAEKTTAIIMTAVESRYFLRINGHPPEKIETVDVNQTLGIADCVRGLIDVARHEVG